MLFFVIIWTVTIIAFLKISKVKLILIIVCIFWVLTLFSVSAVWFSSSPLHRRWEEDSSFRHFVWGKILYYDSDMMMIIAKIMILTKNIKKHVCKLFRLPERMPTSSHMYFMLHYCLFSMSHAQWRKHSPRKSQESFKKSLHIFSLLARIC